MTGPAPLLFQNPMDHLLFVNFPFVARVAELTALRLEKVIILGCVRVVTEDAFAILESRVHMGLVHADLFFTVAAEAELITRGLENEIRYSSVA